MEHRQGAPDASGMICGGSQVEALAPLSGGDLAGASAVVDALAAGMPVTWSIDPDGWRVVTAVPALRIPKACPSATRASPRAVSRPAARGPSGRQVLSSGPTHVVHVVGAGHVGSALAPLLVGLDFRVVLVDERAGLAVGAVAAHERVTRPYEELAEVVRPGRTSFAAITTHSTSAMPSPWRRSSRWSWAIWACSAAARRCAGSSATEKCPRGSTLRWACRSAARPRRRSRSASRPE